MAVIQKRPGGAFQVSVYDPEIKRRRYVGTFRSRREARDAGREAENPRPKRKCPGCGRTFLVKMATQVRCKPRCGLTAPPGASATDHWVYYCYDENDVLLYVGLTSCGLGRHRSHARTAEWWADVDTIKVAHYGTRDEAITAETAAIKKFHPPHNIQGVTGPLDESEQAEQDMSRDTPLTMQPNGGSRGQG